MTAHLNAEQRRALTLLVSIPHGIAEELLILAHEFERAMITGLVHEGLATPRREVVTGPSRTVIDVVRFRITDAGRTALEG